MFFSVFAVSCLLAVQAVPLYEMGPRLDMGISRGILDEVIGPSLGMGRISIIKRSDNEFGRRGSEGSNNEYGDMGYEREGGSSLHDIGNLEHDHKQITENHVSEGHNSGHFEGHSEGHNSGHSEGFGSRGHERGGHSHYRDEEDGYRGQYYGGFAI